MKKICAAYIRVSTRDQEEYSPESQIKLIRDYAKRNDMVLPDEYIFRDDGISGRTAEKRPGFMTMIATAKQKPRPFEAILVWKFSRFARNQEESIVYKSLLRKENQIDVISISEPIMEGPFGGLIERIIEWFDAFYSANLAIEVRRGMTERVSRGLPVSTAPLGYVYDKETKTLVIQPEEAETVRMIFRDFLSGASMIAIAQKLNGLGIKTKRGGIWENRTVRYILTNPIYIGKLRWSKNGANDYHSMEYREGTLVVDGRHESIIELHDFNMAQEQIGEYLRRYKGNGDKAHRETCTWMLQGLVKCSACGGTLTFTGTGMNCSKYVHGKCTVSHFVKQEKLEGMVLTAIAEHMETLDFEIIHRERPQLTGELEQLRLRLRKEQEIFRRHKEAYAAGVDTLEEYRQNKLADEKRIQALKQQLSILSKRPVISKKEFAKKHLETVKTLSSDRLTPGEKNALLRTFVNSITYHKALKKVDVVYYE